MRRKTSLGWPRNTNMQAKLSAGLKTIPAQSHLIDVCMENTSFEPATTSPARQEDSAAPLLLIERVVKEYPTDGEPVRALDDVSLQIDSGEFVALVGRSGCGKSTLLNLAGAMDFPSQGYVLLDGVPTDRLNEAQLTSLRREKVGFIFQSFQLLHTLSVVENVELPLLLAGNVNPRPRAIERLDEVGLAELAYRMPHQLSGGQMQRVAIARALVHSPRILLADEPTGNLDTATGNSILQLLRRVCTEHKTTILMATHSTEAAAVVDITIRMRDGRIVNP
jgi:putative ABC transport system ATP-binding protein